MIKKSNQLNKKIILCTLLVIMLFLKLIPISNAARLSGEVNIYSIGLSDNLLLYQNGYFLTIFDVYENEGEEYPAYNALFPTYNYNNPYDEEIIDEDSFLWQVVANGYPYKSIEELECNTYEEAYTATQAAIYCAHCGHQESDYTYFEGNEASIRTYNAFLKILENARNNKVTINENNVIKLINQQNDWQLDNENQQYLYKTYNVRTNYSIDTYKVKILNSENAIITDENNNIKSEFDKSESFKVILPIKELNNNGELKIQITTDVETMPIYLGTSPYNAYVLTAPRYEENNNIFSQTYQENLTSVNITVQELDTKLGIENSIVNLLDSEKNIISTLTTNEQGKIFIEHLLPGKYYIEQIATEEGYNTYKKLVELNMDYNKMLDLTINNAEENIQNIYNKEENIIITEEIIEKNINNEIIDTNINNKTEITNENNTNNSHTENNETTQNNINNQNTDTNINNKTDITNENNTNNSHTENNETTQNNINNQNTDTNINNKTDITNENNTNNSYTENNETTKNNINNQNTDTNINNKTDITNKNNTNNSHTENNETTQNNINNQNTDTNINNKTDITNENNTNNSHTENNGTSQNNINNQNTDTNLNNKKVGNSNSNFNNYYSILNTQKNETVKTLPKTGM